MPKDVSLPTRKKMRKGTHSCFECRRRKIRCIFPEDNPEVCSECFARGSRCVDQEHADPDVVVDHRKNLRERVSRLEALVDSLLEEKTERTTSDATSISSKPPNPIAKDAYPPTPLSSKASSSIVQDVSRSQVDQSHHVPILSVFEAAINDAEERIKARMEPYRGSTPKPAPVEEDRFTVSYRNDSDVMAGSSQYHMAKKERARQALLATLPPQPQLNKMLNSNSDWWITWRRKCSGTSTTQNETLAQFASRALTDVNIAAMGTVVLAVGICYDDEKQVEKHLDAVDRWVLADDEYAATLEGMELLILKAKWYADVGQPRRAWLAYRKGLMYTQLMGLHRKRTNSATHESIWWSLYHGDRFVSLLLGLPYGITDAHCDLTIPETPNQGPYMAPLTFMNRVSILAGKVIDRNQGVAQQSFAWALQIDQELEDLYKQLDPNWLEYSEMLVDIENNAEVHERIMTQVIYNQIRVHLHLPFMLKSQTNSRFGYSRTACLTGSREVLRLYQVLRSGAVQPLLECKAVDFIGFTSAVLVMLGIFNYGAQNTEVSLKEKEEDIRLIEISIDIFRRASSEKGGKVAMQSGDVLEKMLAQYRAEQSGQVQMGPSECAGGPDKMEFVIPYFGTISIRRGNKPVSNEDVLAAKKPTARCSARHHQQQQHQPPFSTTTTTNPQLTPSTSDTASSLDFFSQSTATNNLTTTPSTTTTTTPSSQPQTWTDPFVSYDGFYNWSTAALDNASPPSHNNANTNTNNNTAPSNDDNDDATAGTATGAQINNDSLSNFPLPTNNFSWQNMPMDIDQDWSWFLNDGGMGAGGAAGGSGSSGGAAGAGLGGVGGSGLGGVAGASASGTGGEGGGPMLVGDLWTRQAFSGF